MNPGKYNTLTLTDATGILKNDGVFLDEKVIYKELSLQIYYLKGFYVQVYVNIFTNQVLNIKAMTTEEDWNSYLDRVSIRELMPD